MQYAKKALAALSVASLMFAGTLVTGTAPASAQKADPSTPAGVEYELPLDRARRESNGGGKGKEKRPDAGRGGRRADDGDGSVRGDGDQGGGSDANGGGSRGSDSGGSDDSPLFGEGISPDGGGSGSAGGKTPKSKGDDGPNPNGGSSAGGGDSSGPTGSAGARANAADPPQSLSRTAAADDGSNGTLLTGAIVLAVLLIGGLTALVVRSGSKRLGS